MWEIKDEKKGDWPVACVVIEHAMLVALVREQWNGFLYIALHYHTFFSSPKGMSQIIIHESNPNPNIPNLNSAALDILYVARFSPKNPENKVLACRLALPHRFLSFTLAFSFVCSVVEVE